MPELFYWTLAINAVLLMRILWYIPRETIARASSRTISAEAELLNAKAYGIKAEADLMREKRYEREEARSAAEAEEEPEVPCEELNHD